MRQGTMRHVAAAFNAKPSRGLEILGDSALLPEPIEPLAVATFLHTTAQLDKATRRLTQCSHTDQTCAHPATPPHPQAAIGEYLSAPSAFEREVLSHFVRFFDFRNHTIDQALRTFLQAPDVSRELDRARQFYIAAPTATPMTAAGVLSTWGGAEDRSRDGGVRVGVLFRRARAVHAPRRRVRARV